jgi:hypothetical protein
MKSAKTIHLEYPIRISDKTDTLSSRVGSNTDTPRKEKGK